MRYYIKGMVEMNFVEDPKLTSAQEFSSLLLVVTIVALLYSTYIWNIPCMIVTGIAVIFAGGAWWLAHSIFT